MDLANSSYANLGIIVLEENQEVFSTWAISARDLGLTGSPSPQDLATKLEAACRHLAAPILLLDGPQGWKHPGNGLQHSRVCERKLNTPGKTGLPGSVKPGNYLPFIAFSIAVFQILVTHGFELGSDRAVRGLAVGELSVVGLAAAPASYHYPQRRRHAARAPLHGPPTTFGVCFPWDVPDGLTHDELQALVAAFAGVALARGCRGRLCCRRYRTKFPRRHLARGIHHQSHAGGFEIL